MFTLVHYDDWRLLVLEVLLACFVIAGIMWVVKLANRNGPPAGKRSGEIARGIEDPPSEAEPAPDLVPLQDESKVNGTANPRQVIG